MSNPYSNAPDRSFWSRSITRVPASDIDPARTPSFRITRETKVGTAGSCFAQNIASYMRKVGLQPFITERPHPEVARLAEHYHYGVYSARYGNLYTARQALQLFERAFGRFAPAEKPWRGKNGEYIDPFRPLIPEGFASLQEFERDREQHFAAVQRLFRELDVLVFTLGLTEGWMSREDGAVFPSCPGTAAGVWDPARYAFHNFSVDETRTDLHDLVRAVRSVNPQAKFIFTVSPVSLVATATSDHVLTATTYSKSVLRVAAQDAADEIEGVDYFPSYEIITGPHAQGAYFAADRRSVTEDGVAHVMRVFAQHYLNGTEQTNAIPLEPAETMATAQARAGIEVICDELYNDQQLKSSISSSRNASVPAGDEPKSTISDELQHAIGVFQKNFSYCSTALPFFPGIGRVLLPPTWERPALVVPLDGHYVVQERVDERPIPWVQQMFADRLGNFTHVLETVKPYLDFDSLPKTDVDGITPFLPNSFFGPMDAAVLTGMLATLKPRSYIEIGSGNSTRFARRAVNLFALKTKIICIDPSPRSSIRAIADEIIPKSLLDVDTSIFDDLGGNDILFFDGSHLSFSGTDCTRFFLEILPHIPQGVYVHVHDIFLPNEYPERMRTRFYNEQQLLAAFLFGNGKFEVVLPVNYLHSLGHCLEGVSFWLKHTAVC